MKRVFIIFLLLYILVSCTSADLYRFNYSDDPGMQDRMEKDYGTFPLWNE